MLHIIFRKGNDDTLSDLYLLSLRGDEPKVGIFKGSGDPFNKSAWYELVKVQFNHMQDVWYNVKILVYNDILKTKIWAEGENEPTEWLIEHSDGDYKTGKIGLSCSNQAYFDDIEVYTLNMTGIKEVNLCYSVNNSALNKLAMEHIDNGNYQAPIPKQTGGTAVSFYVEAVDYLGNSVESESVSYVVQVPPPLEIPWTTIGITASAAFIIMGVWFAFRKGYLAIEIIE